MLLRRRHLPRASRDLSCIKLRRSCLERRHPQLADACCPMALDQRDSGIGDQARGAPRSSRLNERRRVRRRGGAGSGSPGGCPRGCPPAARCCGWRCAAGCCGWRCLAFADSSPGGPGAVDSSPGGGGSGTGAVDSSPGGGRPGPGGSGGVTGALDPSMGGVGVSTLGGPASGRGCAARTARASASATSISAGIPSQRRSWASGRDAEFHE